MKSDKSLWIVCLILVVCMSYWHDSLSNQIRDKKPVIIYQVDNAHGQLIGTVTGKEQIDGHYTVTIGAYGKFLVTREQYDSLNIGDDAPDYLKQRGVASNKVRGE